jgi:CSLREA domain-containing protein
MRKSKLVVLLGLLAAMALLMAEMPPLAARAGLGSTINVDATTDEMDVNDSCSLREAIQAANTDSTIDACSAGNGADIITVPPGTYTLAIPGADEDAGVTGDLDITSNLTINGTDAIIQACDSTNGPCAGIDRVFQIVQGPGLNVTVAINGVTIRNGSTSRGGGGITNAGMLALTETTVSNNTATNASGGGIHNSGTLVLDNSSVLANSMVADEEDLGGGGGIYSSGTLSITDSIVSDNSAVGSFGGAGGGITNDGGTATLARSAVSGNTTFVGGGIFNRGGQLTVENSSISNNTALNNGGAIFNRDLHHDPGTLTFTNSTVSGNTAANGGGISNDDTATITASTVSQNTAIDLGGGILNSGRMTISNSTVSGNSANSGGGMKNIVTNFFPGGGLIVSSSTVAYNTAASGGGLANNNSSATVENTILANPSGGDCSSFIPSALHRDIVSLGHNLTSDDSCAFGTVGDRQDAAPVLGPLADNGGPTKTHLLLAGSPAVEGGGLVSCPSTDQRGTIRPQGNACDIGAVEVTATEFAQPGDVNCDLRTNSIDAALELQFIGALVPGLDCVEYADVNRDGRIDAVDAALILQYTAGLLGRLAG